MFFSYIVHDVVEIEPVYLPHPRRATRRPIDGRGTIEDKGESNVRAGTTAGATSATTATTTASAAVPHCDSRRTAGQDVNTHPSPRPHTPVYELHSPVTAVFGSLDKLNAYLQAQEARSLRAALSSGNPLRSSDGGSSGNHDNIDRDGEEHNHENNFHHDHGDGEVENEDEDDTYSVGVADAVIHRLTERYVGRVLPCCGLCVAIRDVLELSAAEIRGASASAWVGVVFDVCVLAPRPGVRLRARIRAHTQSGLYLSLIDFLAATLSVFVPAAELLDGSQFDEVRGVWYLAFDESGSSVPGAITTATTSEDEKHVLAASGGEVETNRNDYSVGDIVVCKVLQCNVKSESDVLEAYNRQQQQQQLVDEGSASTVTVVEAEHASALVDVVASFAGDGLGPLSWFEDTAEGDEETAS